MAAAETLGIFLTGHCENKGLAAGKDVQLESQSLINQGTITSLKSLSLKVQETFKHYREGKLEAREAIVVLAKDLQLVGQLMAGGDFTATIERDFEYNTETLWAIGLIKLMLQRGYDFTKPIITPGSLSIETPADLVISTKVQTGKNFSSTSGNFSTFKGGVFAGGSLTVKASQNVQVGQAIPGTEKPLVSDGAYLASQGSMHLEGSVIRNTLSEIYTNDNLVLQALQLIENSGNVTVAGSAQVIAPLFKHQLLTQSYHNGARVLSASPTMTVSGNATFSSSVDMLGAHLHVGGTLSQTPGASFLARSFEEFREWIDSDRVKGKRKEWYKGGGHHFHTQHTTHHQTTGIHDSHVSAGVAIHLDHINKLINQGAFRTPQLNASFQEFHNGNSFTTSFEASPFQERTELQKYFRENALFGRVGAGAYINAPKVPFTFNLPLMPSVHFDSPLASLNTGNVYMFAPMIEKDLVQKALQELVRSGYIDKDAGSPEAVFAQLRKNAHDYFVGPNLQVSETQSYSVDPVLGDGDCLFESCLRALKALPQGHAAHAIANNQALRALVLETLPTRIDGIRDRVHAVLTGAMSVDEFSPGPFSDRLRVEHREYTHICDTSGPEVAEHSVNAYLQEAPAAYIADMRQSGTWGGDMELGIIGQRLNVNIRVHHAANTIAGYQYQRTDDIGNDPARPTIDIMYTGNHYDNLKPQHTIPVTETALQASPKAMLVYQLQNFEGRVVSAPILFIPQAIRNAIGAGRSDQAVVCAENGILSGDTLHSTGQIKVNEHLHLNVNKVFVEQKIYTAYEYMQRSRKAGHIYVPVQKAVDGSGDLYAGRLTGKLQTFQQLGGHVHSGVGGTDLEIRDGALVQALMTTEAVQDAISRKDRSYHNERAFIPAKITSNGEQRISVTDGPFTAEGMHSSARGKNTLEALKDIQIRNMKASSELASQKHRSRFMGSKRTETGGTSFSNLESVFLGGEGIAMTSEEGTIELVNTLLVSGGDATLKAKKMVSILDDTAETRSYAKQSGFKGFSHNKKSIYQSSTHSLGSQAFINGNFNITADDEIRLRNLTGVVKDDMSLQALHVILEGAMEQSTTTHKTKSLGISFFGSSSIEDLMAGKSGKAALQQLLREDAFANALEHLSHTTDGGDATIQAVQTLIEGWRLATMIADACDKPMPNGSGDVLGGFTDRWGLTTATKDAAGNVTGHTFNPKFTFSFNQSTSTTTKTCMAPTTLRIGGNLRIVAGVIQLLDGTQIQAENIQLDARKLLEIRAARNTETTDFRQNGGSVSFHLNGDFAGASAHESKHHSETIQYQNTCLKARNLLSIPNDGKTTIQGAELEGRDVMIKRAELLLESLQDTHNASGHSNSVSIDSEGHGGVQSGKESAHKAWVNQPTFIKAERNLDIFIDYLIQKGSVLSSDQKLRVHGLMHETPLQWIHEDVYDSESSNSTNVNLSYQGQNDSFLLTGSLHHTSRKKESITRATIAALDLAGYVPSSINRDLKRTQETLSDKRRSIGVPIAIPNPEQLKKEASSLSQALQGKKIPPPPPVVLQAEAVAQLEVQKNNPDEKRRQKETRENKSKAEMTAETANSKMEQEEANTAKSRVRLPVTDENLAVLAQDDYDNFMGRSESVAPAKQQNADAASEKLNIVEISEFIYGAISRGLELVIEFGVTDLASRIPGVGGPALLVCEMDRTAARWEAHNLLLSSASEDFWRIVNHPLTPKEVSEQMLDAAFKPVPLEQPETKTRRQTIKENPEQAGAAFVDNVYSAYSLVSTASKAYGALESFALSRLQTAHLNQVNKHFEDVYRGPGEVPVNPQTVPAFVAFRKRLDVEGIPLRLDTQNGRSPAPPLLPKQLTTMPEVPAPLPVNQKSTIPVPIVVSTPELQAGRLNQVNKHFEDAHRGSGEVPVDPKTVPVFIDFRKRLGGSQNALTGGCENPKVPPPPLKSTVPAFNQAPK